MVAAAHGANGGVALSRRYIAILALVTIGSALLSQAAVIPQGGRQQPLEMLPTQSVSKHANQYADASSSSSLSASNFPALSSNSTGTSTASSTAAPTSSASASAAKAAKPSAKTTAAGSSSAAKSSTKAKGKTSTKTSESSSKASTKASTKSSGSSSKKSKATSVKSGKTPNTLLGHGDDSMMSKVLSLAGQASAAATVADPKPTSTGPPPSTSSTPAPPPPPSDSSSSAKPTDPPAPASKVKAAKAAGVVTPTGWIAELVSSMYGSMPVITASPMPSDSSSAPQKSSSSSSSSGQGQGKKASKASPSGHAKDASEKSSAAPAKSSKETSKSSKETSKSSKETSKSSKETSKESSKKSSKETSKKHPEKTSASPAAKAASSTPPPSSSSASAEPSDKPASSPAPTTANPAPSTTLASSDFAAGTFRWDVGALGCPSGAATINSGISCQETGTPKQKRDETILILTASPTASAFRVEYSQGSDTRSDGHNEDDGKQSARKEKASFSSTRASPTSTATVHDTHHDQHDTDNDSDKSGVNKELDPSSTTSHKHTLSKPSPTSTAEHSKDHQDGDKASKSTNHAEKNTTQKSSDSQPTSSTPLSVTNQSLDRRDIGWLDLLVGGVPNKGTDLIPSIAWVISVVLLIPVFAMRIMRRSTPAAHAHCMGLIFATGTLAAFGARSWMSFKTPTTTMMMFENITLQSLPAVLVEGLMSLLTVYAKQSGAQSAGVPRVALFLRFMNVLALLAFVTTAVLMGRFMQNWDGILQNNNFVQAATKFPSTEPQSFIRIAPIVGAFMQLVVLAGGLLLIPVVRNQRSSMRPTVFLAILKLLIAASVLYRVMQSTHGQEQVTNDGSGFGDDLFSNLASFSSSSSGAAAAPLDLHNAADHAAVRLVPLSQAAPVGMYATDHKGIDWAQLQRSYAARDGPQAPVPFNALFVLPMWAVAALMLFVRTPVKAATSDAMDASEKSMNNEAPKSEKAEKAEKAETTSDKEKKRKSDASPA